MTREEIRESAATVRNLASCLNFRDAHVNTLTVVLGMLDVVEGLVEHMGEGGGLPAAGSALAGAVLSQCPNCGEEISLDVSSLRGIESVVCANCHEPIGVISASV